MPRKLYRFGGMTFVLEADSPIADSPMCEPFRVGAGEPADHTVRLTFSDRVPDPPQNALRQGPLYRWYTGSTRCTLQRYSAPGRTPQFTQAETRPGHTDLVFAESYRTGASARVVLESAGLFDILADAGMLVLHSAYIVTRQGEGILFSGPSGIGKSTQAALWQRYGAAQTVNGDRALVRPDTGTVSGVMYAGTSGICRNVTAPLPGGGAAASGPGEPGDGYPAPGGLCPGAESVRLSPVGPRLRRADDGAGGPAGYQRTRPAAGLPGG